jgi:hypothetical protein
MILAVLSHFLFTLLKFHIYRCHPVYIVIDRLTSQFMSMMRFSSDILQCKNENRQHSKD